MATILACHGFTGEGADFEPLRAVLPTGHVLVAPDFPGHGSRRGLRAPADYSLAAHLATLDESIRAVTEPVTLLGYSLGGRLALHWALANPGKFRQLILVGASPGLATEAERTERTYADAAVAKYLRTGGLPTSTSIGTTSPSFGPSLPCRPHNLSPSYPAATKTTLKALP